MTKIYQGDMMDKIKQAVDRATAPLTQADAAFLRSLNYWRFLNPESGHLEFEQLPTNVQRAIVQAAILERMKR